MRTPTQWPCLLTTFLVFYWLHAALVTLDFTLLVEVVSPGNKREVRDDCQFSSRPCPPVHSRRPVFARRTFIVMHLQFTVRSLVRNVVPTTFLAWGCLRRPSCLGPRPGSGKAVSPRVRVQGTRGHHGGMDQADAARAAQTASGRGGRARPGGPAGLPPPLPCGPAPAGRSQGRAGTCRSSRRVAAAATHLGASPRARSSRSSRSPRAPRSPSARPPGPDPCPAARPAARPAEWTPRPPPAPPAPPPPPTTTTRRRCGTSSST